MAQLVARRVWDAEAVRSSRITPTRIYNKMDKLRKSRHIRGIKHGVKKAKKWSDNNHRMTVIILSVIAVIVIALIAVKVVYNGKAAPGTTVAGVDVGGQNEAQIKKTADNLIKNFKLSLSYNGKSVTASAKDLGISLDSDNIAKKAVQTGNNNSLAILTAHKNFSLSGSYDKAKVEKFVVKSFSELTTDPKDAQIIYNRDTNRYVVQKGATGKKVKMDGIYSEIDKLLKAPKLSHYQIKTDDSKPKISDAAASKTANKLNDTLSKQIAISYQDKTIWTIDPWTIADWTTLSYNNSSSSFDISYDKNKIKTFVTSSVDKQRTDQPVDQIAITDANKKILKSISDGKKGRELDNADDMVNDIVNKLKNSEGGTVYMTTKEAKEGLDARVAKDGHWIEYNISTYTVSLYDGKKVSWSTDQTAHGKDSTPTITGLYSVWYKVGEQCMPNPPSSEPLCGIHWITYWEKSGYAFHEAWWLNSGNVRTGLSHGCVNMYKDDAKRVYDWASIGTPVYVHY